MSNVKMFCDALPNIPWQEKPADVTAPVWRYNENPIIDRNPVEGVARIFNSAVVPYEGKFIGVFRGEQIDGIPYIYLGRSEDGIHWNFDKDKIPFVNEKGEPFMPVYAYDPRLVKVEDTYYIIWCQDFYGASIGIAKTTDFKTFVRIENPFIPFNRNAVLFPRKINGLYTLLSRPSDSGHTPFGDIFLSQSPDMEFWGRHRHVMSKGSNWWESVKIGGGAAPIETSEGWLLFYHGVTGLSDSISAVPIKNASAWLCFNAEISPSVLTPLSDTSTLPRSLKSFGSMADSFFVISMVTSKVFKLRLLIPMISTSNASILCNSASS